MKPKGATVERRHREQAYELRWNMKAKSASPPYRRWIDGDGLPGAPDDTVGSIAQALADAEQRGHDAATEERILGTYVPSTAQSRKPWQP